jgi:hypothetical protein
MIQWQESWEPIAPLAPLYPTYPEDAWVYAVTVTAGATRWWFRSVWPPRQAYTPAAREHAWNKWNKWLATQEAQAA